jgi:hypothetical protein
MLKIDRVALIKCRLGFIEAQKFRTTTSEYLVMFGILFSRTLAKLGGWLHEAKRFH